MVAIIAVLAVVVVLQVRGSGSGAHEVTMRNDISTVQTAVGRYYLKGGKYPTITGDLPSGKEGDEYLDIEWDASFKMEGETYFFVPDYLVEAPPHAYDEPSIWWIDASGKVLIDPGFDPEKY